MLKAKSKGVTLLEVMLAVTILSVGLVMVVRSYTSCLRTIKITQNLLLANLLLEEKIWQKEEEKLSTAIFIEGQEENQFDPPWDNFRYEISLEPVEEELPQDYEDNLRKCSLQVRWRQGSREQATSCVSFLRSKE